MAELTLDVYADSVCEQLRKRSEPAVLVPNSMGGMVATQAAARCPELVASIVYVAAFLPQDGDSLLALTQLPEGADDQIQANLVVEGDPPVAVLSPEASLDAMYLQCTEQTADWAITKPEAAARAALHPARLAARRSVRRHPRSYVLCTRDRSIPPALQRRMVATAGITDVVELDTDHAPHLSATEELAAALDARVPERAARPDRRAEQCGGVRAGTGASPRGPAGRRAEGEARRGRVRGDRPRRLRALPLASRPRSPRAQNLAAVRAAALDTATGWSRRSPPASWRS